MYDLIFLNMKIKIQNFNIKIYYSLFETLLKS